MLSTLFVRDGFLSRNSCLLNFELTIFHSTFLPFSVHLAVEVELLNGRIT
jgi:hypothetical protein